MTGSDICDDALAAFLREHPDIRARAVANADGDVDFAADQPFA
jgi:hypothetical protein